MENFKKYFTSLMAATISGLKTAIVIGFIVGLVTFLGAHSLFGIVFITAGMVATVVVYTVVSFIVGFVAKLLGLTDRKIAGVTNLGNLTGK
jgi:hypothetical protein